MANTKSAEKRARQSERRRLRNRSVKTRLHSLEKTLHAAIATGKKDESGKALKDMASAFDKAVKGGIIRKETANRKKSRLTLRVNKVK
jgi:small subunit ribosomal protein S20